MTHMAAVKPGSGFDMTNEAVLGVLEFHSIPEVKIAQGELTDMWERHGLDRSFIPRIRPVDAFRRATSAVQRTITIDNDGVRYEARIEVDDVTKDGDRVVRLLNRKLIDKVNQETPLVTVGKFEFDRTSGMMRIFGSSVMQHEHDYEALLQDAKNLYCEYKDYHNRDTLRNVVAKLVRSTDPISIQDRSQGKFIPRQHITTMENLKRMLVELKERCPGQECDLLLLPMIDCEDLRQAIAQRLTVEVQDEATAILDEAKTAKQKGKLKLEKAQGLVDRFIDLRSKIDHYEQLISTTLPSLRKHIAWAMDNIEDDVDTAVQPLALA